MQRISTEYYTCCIDANVLILYLAIKKIIYPPAKGKPDTLAQPNLTYLISIIYICQYKCQPWHSPLNVNLAQPISPISATFGTALPQFVPCASLGVQEEKCFLSLPFKPPEYSNKPLDIQSTGHQGKILKIGPSCRLFCHVGKGREMLSY
jgi:hypothetical protein